MNNQGCPPPVAGARVPLQNKTKVELPTTGRMNTRSQSRQKYKIGTIVKKRFQGEWHDGEITKYNPITGYYTIG